MRKGSSGLWEIVEYGRAKDEGARVIDSVNPNQAEEVYNAISEYGGYNREAIDLVEFNVEGGSETPIEMERRASAQTYLNNIFDGGNNLKNGDNIVDVKDYFESIKKKYGLENVEITDTTKDNKPEGIIIDGKEYNLTDKTQAKTAYDLLQKMMTGSSSQPQPSKTDLVPSEKAKGL